MTAYKSGEAAASTHIVKYESSLNPNNSGAYRTASMNWTAINQ
jgi:hypothetical protein